MGPDDHHLLDGGIANAGAVVRRGDLVLRPAGPHTAAVHEHLAALRAAGFGGVPEPRGVDDDGRERLAFVPGDVDVPPYPAWAQTDAALASIAGLVRRMHDAAARVGAADGTWKGDRLRPASRRLRRRRVQRPAAPPRRLGTVRASRGLVAEPPSAPRRRPHVMRR